MGCECTALNTTLLNSSPTAPSPCRNRAQVDPGQAALSIFQHVDKGPCGRRDNRAQGDQLCIVERQATKYA